LKLNDFLAHILHKGQPTRQEERAGAYVAVISLAPSAF